MCYVREGILVNALSLMLIIELVSKTVYSSAAKASRHHEVEMSQTPHQEVPPLHEPSIISYVCCLMTLCLLEPYRFEGLWQVEHHKTSVKHTTTHHKIIC